jgi:hypothetical protein
MIAHAASYAVTLDQHKEIEAKYEQERLARMKAEEGEKQWHEAYEKETASHERTRTQAEKDKETLAKQLERMDRVIESLDQNHKFILTEVKQLRQLVAPEKKEEPKATEHETL